MKGSSVLSSKRIILSPFTKEFRGEGHSYESLNFSGATFVAVSIMIHSRQQWDGLHPPIRSVDPCAQVDLGHS